MKEAKFPELRIQFLAKVASTGTQLLIPDPRVRFLAKPAIQKHLIPDLWVQFLARNRKEAIVLRIGQTIVIGKTCPNT